jgi:predicted polyphosphate/ATP-dependent NAD kinase
VRAFLARKADLILFCGGDGTARDVAALTGTDTAILGIPSGVKMFSGVFGTSPAHTAEILADHLAGRLTLTEVEVLDLDEEKYRHGDWAVRLYHAAVTPFEPAHTQASKTLIAAASDADAREDIAKYLAEEYGENADVLLLLGAGSTVAAVGKALGIDKTLLGIDATVGGDQVGRDLDERGLLDLLERHKDKTPKLVLSPIGAQGFVLGRGTAQLSAAVLRRIGRENLVVVATPPKLAQTPTLRFDTGDADLDREMAGNGYLAVVTGYGTLKTVKTAG